MADARGRVLVVDDSEDDHLQIQRLLRGEVELFRAYTGTEAIERLERDAFDALISDQKMPRMSGDELIEQIKGQERTANLRCILLSGRTSDEQLVRILRSGQIFRYFEKNRTLLTADGRAELLLAVRNAVQASRLERQHYALNVRLTAQVDALSDQYRLLRRLLAAKSPSAMLRLTVDSLADRVRCRGAFGFVDLRPEQGSFGFGALRTGARSIGQQRFTAWSEATTEGYRRLSGRAQPPVSFASVRGEVVPGDAGPAPTEAAPAVPIFVNQDLRGLLMLAREEPLAPDEAEVVRIWRDQLQDALSRTRTQLLDEQRRIELMLDAMTEGVVLTDQQGAVTLMNPVARRMLGIEESDRPDLTVVLRTMGLSSVDVLRRIGAREVAADWWDLEVGEATWQVLFAPVRDHAARSVGVLTVLRDVTEDKRGEKRREEFVHIIGHELRGPLTSISGILDLLGRRILGELSERQREYVDLAKKSCIKINQLLNDLLDLAKFEGGRMPMSVEAMALEQVVAGVVRGFRAAALEAAVQLSFRCDLEGLVCQGDAGRIGQVVTNLLTNGLKHTPEGGTVTVAVFTTFTAPDHYLVTVHNTGVELEQADLDRIFDKFEQVEMTAARGGTGLGLAVCRNIVEGHGGRIWVESGDGEGTTFAFSLPVHGETRARGVGVVRAEERAVLVVGPEPAECRALRALLMEHGYDVRIAGASVDAVRRRLPQWTPASCVYLDVDDEPDLEVIEELVGAQGLPVLALLPAGARAPSSVDATLDVPPDTAVLASMLKVVVARHRMRRRMRVLLAGPDVAANKRVAARLEESGLLVYTASDAAEGQRRVGALLPDLVVVDAELGDAAQVLAQAAAGEITTPILVLGSAAQHEALGVAAESRIEAGTPVDGLLTRIRGRLARGRGSADSLVVLPGGRALQREVLGRMREQQPFAYCAIDIVGLRDGVERFGFMWGHTAMSHTAELVQAVLDEHADGRAFLGHQRDDDFHFLVAPEHVAAVCAEVERAFGKLAPAIAGKEHELGIALALTAIVDETSRFDGFSALQAALSAARRRKTGEVVLIDRG